MVRIPHPGDTVGVTLSWCKDKGLPWRSETKVQFSRKDPGSLCIQYSSLVSAPGSPTPRVLARVNPAMGTSVPLDIQNGGPEG